MRMRFLIIFALTAAFTFSVWVTPACGQDPADVNSKTIRVRFENDRVRVLEAILPPGSKEQVHSHPAYVIYVLAGGRYRNYAADGKITEGTFQTGDVIYRDPSSRAQERGRQWHVGSPLTARGNLPQPRIATSSSINAVSFSSAGTTKRIAIMSRRR